MNITAITQNIAIIPEVVRESIGFARWSRSTTLARLNGTDEHDHEHTHVEAMEPWQSGRLAMEIVTLIRSHRDFPEGHREAMDAAVEDIDSPQTAIDLIMALASMFAHVVTDEQIDMFSQSLVEAEARTS